MQQIKKTRNSSTIFIADIGMKKSIYCEPLESWDLYFYAQPKSFQFNPWSMCTNIFCVVFSSIMGKSYSKNDKIDSSGTVNNNIVLTSTDIVNVYSEELLYCLLVLIGLKVYEILMVMYLKHRRHWKKTYMNRENPA